MPPMHKIIKFTSSGDNGVKVATNRTKSNFTEITLSRYRFPYKCFSLVSVSGFFGVFLSLKFTFRQASSLLLVFTFN